MLLIAGSTSAHHLRQHFNKLKTENLCVLTRSEHVFTVDRSADMVAFALMCLDLLIGVV